VITGIWEDFLKIIKEEVGSRVVETWFKAVSLSSWDAQKKVVHVRAPNAFVRDWIQRNYLDLIQIHLGRLLNCTNLTLVFVDADARSNATIEKFNPIIPAIVLPVEQMRQEANTLPSQDILVKPRGHMNSTYSFNTFVVGPSNSLAFAAAHAVTEKPGRLYNPLFIYGGSGLGKTHLLHSIGNGIKRQHEKAVVLYQPTDRFITEFINAIRFNKVHTFHAKYKNVDVLLMDDVQFISNKEQTQEAFFHIFNFLHESHKQIVLSSDTVPNDIEGLAERLRSRLAWGLVADIQQPLLETKIAIIKKKAELNNEVISDEVAHFIASGTISNIRELEGALIRVVAFASLTKQAITLDLAEKVLAYARESNSRAIDLQDVVTCIKKHYSFDLNDLRSKNRNKELSFARQVAMFLMKKMTNKSLRDIGDFLGGRDHSTVMHAISRIELHAASSSQFQEKLRRMEREAAP